MSRPLSRATLALLAASFVVACSQPFLPGPQLQRQLRGFFYDANSTQVLLWGEARKMTYQACTDRFIVRYQKLRTMTRTRGTTRPR